MIRTACLLPFLLLLSGCSATMKPIDFPAESAAAHTQLMTQIASQEEITAPISLYEAMARALKYNLDQRIEAYDARFRQQQIAVTRSGMWPSLMASLGYNARNNDSGSSSRSLLSGRQSLEPSTSSEREYGTADLTASWNLLDFGLSYVRSQQNVADEWIAEEHRRKVINRILEDVRTAYWRAVSAERTYKKLIQIEADAEQALMQAQELESLQLVPPLAVLTYERDLLRVQGDVQKLQRELILSKRQLAALINLHPATRFKLQLPQRTDIVPMLPGSARQMVMLGLIYRPEMRELIYEQKKNQLELKNAFIEVLPQFELVFGTNYDGNDYVYNNRWARFSSQVSWNLLSLFRYPLRKNALKAEAKVLDAREQALVLAIMTQVHVARARFIRLSQELNSARRLCDVQERILGLTRSAFKASKISRRDLVKEEMTSILDEVRYDAAYADLQNAYANLYASMGVDNLGFDINEDSTIERIAEQLKKHWAEQAGQLPKVELKRQAFLSEREK